MRKLQVLSLLLVVGLSAPGQAQPTVAETGDGIEISISLDGDNPRVAEARPKLVRVLAEHNLRPWVYTHDVIITSEGFPHSHPVLTLTTESEYFEDDLRQLNTFVHEQLHWFAEENEDAVRRTVRQLRKCYPDVPVGGGQGARSEYSTYLHLIINWLTLDAMAELVGEEEARRIASTQDHYRWIYERVLEDTEEIGAIVASEGLLITPDKGLVVG